jgi:hypothetical protein
MTSLLLATLALCFLEWRATGSNVGTAFNGYGAIPGTLRKDNPAPMRYRVLVPWLMWALYQVGKRCVRGFELKVWHYQAVKAVFALCALAAIQSLLGTPGMWLMTLLIASTVEFDYWDQYTEILGVALILRGEPGLVALGALIWGLSRETVGLAPILAFASHGLYAGLTACCGPLAALAVRLIQGKAELYCKRWTFRAYNLVLDKELVYSVALTVATMVVVFCSRSSMPPALATTARAPLAWLGAGWLMARARETRIFLPAMVWLIGGTV